MQTKNEPSSIMDPTLINWWAVLVAALSMFLLGGLWYAVLFEGAWRTAAGLDEEDLRQGRPAVIFGLSFLFSLIMAANLAAFLADEGTDVIWGMSAGFLAGFGWVALGLCIVALFERRSWRYMVINGGYMVLAFVIMGAILGAWR